jgi:hypothetical protein
MARNFPNSATLAAIREDFNAVMAGAFDASEDFTVDSPTVIESDPYVTADER